MTDVMLALAGARETAAVEPQAPGLARPWSNRLPCCRH